MKTTCIDSTSFDMVNEARIFMEPVESSKNKDLGVFDVVVVWCQRLRLPTKAYHHLAR